MDPPATAVGDMTELLDVDVQQLAGLRALIPAIAVPSAAQLSGEPVDLGQPRQRGAGEHRPDGGGRQPRIAASRTGPAWCSVRAATIGAVVSGEVFVGMRGGREERSASPASPSARQRRIHLKTVCRLTPSCLATSPGR